MFGKANWTDCSSLFRSCTHFLFCGAICCITFLFSVGAQGRPLKEQIGVLRFHISSQKITFCRNYFLKVFKTKPCYEGHA